MQPLMGNNGTVRPPAMTAPRMNGGGYAYPMRQQYLPGRFINNENEIVPGEIPMDGSISFFCLNDLSRIVIKQWNAQGLLDTMTYVIEKPEVAPQPQSQQQEPMQPEAPIVQQPDQMASLQASIEQLSQSIETAFNNLGGAFNQAIGTINAKLDAMEGRG